MFRWSGLSLVPRPPRSAFVVAVRIATKAGRGGLGTRLVLPRVKFKSHAGGHACFSLLDTHHSLVPRTSTLTLYAIKNWRCRRPGNKANS